VAQASRADSKAVQSARSLDAGLGGAARGATALDGMGGGRGSERGESGSESLDAAAAQRSPVDVSTDASGSTSGSAAASPDGASAQTSASAQASGSVSRQ